MHAVLSDGVIQHHARLQALSVCAIRLLRRWLLARRRWLRHACCAQRCHAGARAVKRDPLHHPNVRRSDGFAMVIDGIRQAGVAFSESRQQRLGYFTTPSCLHQTRAQGAYLCRIAAAETLFWPAASCTCVAPPQPSSCSCHKGSAADTPTLKACANSIKNCYAASLSCAQTLAQHIQC